MMEILILCAVILAGSIIQSFFGFLFTASKREAPEATFDELTDARYGRLASL